MKSILGTSDPVELWLLAGGPLVARWWPAGGPLVAGWWLNLHLFQHATFSAFFDDRGNLKACGIDSELRAASIYGILILQKRWEVDQKLINI